MALKEQVEALIAQLAAADAKKESYNMAEPIDCPVCYEEIVDHG